MYFFRLLVLCAICIVVQSSIIPREFTNKPHNVDEHTAHRNEKQPKEGIKKKWGGGFGGSRGGFSSSSGGRSSGSSGSGSRTGGRTGAGIGVGAGAGAAAAAHRHHNNSLSSSSSSGIHAFDPSVPLIFATGTVLLSVLV